jgi:3-O-methylgallate 3,4-dioxygenase
MARIVLGLGTAHAPTLNAPPELWGLRAKHHERMPDLVGLDGKPHSYQELLTLAGPSVAAEVTKEKWQKRHSACQVAIAKLSETFAQVSPDILIIIGDDQKELFDEGNMPAVCIYWGDSVKNIPRYSSDTAPIELKATAWGYGEEERDFPVASGLGKHLIEYLMNDGFDVAHSRRLAEGQGIGHAFSFIFRRIMDGTVIPTVPVMLNTYYPPNQPTPQRCYQLGRALRDAVEAWPSDARVAVLASGGLSHFMVDEALDRQVIKAMQDGDDDALCSLPRERLNSGSSEIRNWISAAGAAGHLEMKLIDYVPVYLTPAGTGIGAGFAVWS